MCIICLHILPGIYVLFFNFMLLLWLLNIVNHVSVAGTICDEECNSFRQLLQSWSPTKPKALIYFLVQKSSLKLLQKSLNNLDR